MRTLALILTLFTAVVHGAVEFDGTDDWATVSTAEVTAEPFTACCYVEIDTVDINHTFLSFGDTAGTSNWYRLAFGTNGRKPAAGSYDGSLKEAQSSVALASNVWVPVCAVFASTTSRAAFRDGSGKGTNITSASPAGIDATGLAVLHRLTDIDPLDGTMAECGIWSDALADDEIAQFADKFAPPCISRSTLIAYYPLVTVEDGVTLHDFASGTSTNLTISGTPADASHPRVTHCN